MASSAYIAAAEVLVAVSMVAAAPSGSVVDGAAGSKNCYPEFRLCLLAILSSAFTDSAWSLAVVKKTLPNGRL